MCDCSYILTIEYLINENINIKKIDEAINDFANLTNAKLVKSDIIYNNNKRHKILQKDIMFNNYIFTFSKFIDLKKYINYITKNFNNFDKKIDVNPITTITKYCSKKKNIDNNSKKYENNIIISNIEKSKLKNNKKYIENIFDIKKNYNQNQNQNITIGNSENSMIIEKIEKPDDKYNVLQKYIIDYYMQNNIIN
jgi:hypothetical protein